MTRDEAIERFENVKANALVQKASGVSEYWQNEIDGTIKAIDMAIESLSAEKGKENGTFVNRDNCSFNCNDSNRTLVEPKWITDSKPTEDGTYMVTLDAFGHKHINLFYYGKPIMPNRKVKGKCWYRSDSEWGDVVYDDDEILAWLPLPKPYREDGEECD